MLLRPVLGGNSEALFTFHHARERVGIIWTLAIQGAADTLLKIGHHHHPMKCWHCENEAKAICVFCGRGVCAAHRQAKAHFAGYGLKKRPLLVRIFDFPSPTATCVRDASWCGVCQVENVETY